MGGVMSWFPVFGAAIGYFGTRTAWVNHRTPKRRWSRESVFLLCIAWTPILIWILARFVPAAD